MFVLSSGGTRSCTDQSSKSMPKKEQYNIYIMHNDV